VIAPSHYEAFAFTSVYDGDGYVTPLGVIPVDKAFASRLAKMSSSIQLPNADMRPPQRAPSMQLKWNCHGCSTYWARSRWCRL